MYQPACSGFDRQNYGSSHQEKQINTVGGFWLDC
jgi:hypothetical protein